MLQKGNSALRSCVRKIKKYKAFEIPVAKINQVSEATGAGDAYRAGLIKGLSVLKNDIVHAVKIGAVCAAYCVEVYGPQNFHFTHEAFNNRLESVFGEKAFRIHNKRTKCALLVQFVLD